MAKNGSNKDTFEESMAMLEEIVSKLESGNLSLDDSINEFETAIGLIKKCESKLENAKAKIRILTESSDGSVRDMPFSNVVNTDEN